MTEAYFYITYLEFVSPKLLLFGSSSTVEEFSFRTRKITTSTLIPSFSPGGRIGAVILDDKSMKIMGCGAETLLCYTFELGAKLDEKPLQFRFIK